MTGCLTMLGRLGRDNAGNTLAIAAASLLPMMALIGGGIDVSRSYMAKTELQSACDAGVLAGRKAMSKTGVYENPEKLKASKMFNFNFVGSKFSARNLAFSTSSNADGQVLGTASVELPTLVMKIFDKDKVDLSVNCMAELQIGNVDVMFVLDNTHSMLCTPEDQKNPCTQLAINNNTTRFYGLKEAVKDFHKTINSSVTDTRTRIRYGFVPYAMTVNVNGLFSDTLAPLPSSAIADSSTYWSRVAKYGPDTFVTAPYTGKDGNAVNTTEYYYNSGGTKTKISSSNCTKFGNNTYPTSTGINPVPGGGPAPAASTTTTYSYGGRDGSGTNEYCWRKKSVVTTTYTGTTWYEFSQWIYRQEPINTATYKTRGTTTFATTVKADSTTPGANSRSRFAKEYDMVELAAASAAGEVTGVSTTTDTWNGCIEERATEEPYGSYDFDPIPSTAYDLQFDTKATTDATRWKPMWQTMYYEPKNTRTYYFKLSNAQWYSNSGKTTTANPSSPPTTHPTEYCPAEMRLFDTKYATLSTNKTLIPTELTNYLNTLAPAMYTYHDIGMIWGGRLTSPTGLFAANVNKDADKINVSRHIIFMTDGQLQPEEAAYSAYGIENYDHRIAPSGSESTIYNRHMARFEAMCKAIKSQGTTIWVVSFASTMTTQLQNCATAGRAYYSNNTTALRNTFKYIAAQVADLRLGA